MTENKLISYDELKGNLESGMTMTEIAKKMGIHKSTLFDKRKEMGFSIRGKFHCIPNLQPSNNLSYIIGVIMGDACVVNCKIKNTKYYIRQVTLPVKRKEFADSFYDALKAIGLHPYYRFYREYHKVVASNKEFVLWYKKLTLDDIERIITGFEKDFIRGFYESEGSYYRQYNNRRKWVAIGCIDLDKISLVSKIINKIGIYHKLNAVKVGKKCFSYGKREFYYIIHIRKGDNPQRFIEMIKPCIKNS